MRVAKMSVRRIYTIEDPVLRRKAKKVKSFNEELKLLADDMVETMGVSDGVGLAASQIGVSERVVVIKIPETYEDSEAGKLYVLVNPEITVVDDEELIASEGCLSIPGILGDVPRAGKIKVKAQSVKGKPIRIKAEDYLARIFQHEIDHLDGVLFIDRVEDPTTLRRITEEGEIVPIDASIQAGS
jgi:peptide deformylase